MVERIRGLDCDITELAAQTYPWARRPLLLSCLFLLLTAVVAGGIARSHNRFMGTEVKPSSGNSSSLSQVDLESILAQGEKFAQETRERQAEAMRKESERMQQRIAEAERTYKAQAERQRLEQEKNARELAQKEEQTRRKEAEREKQREQIAAAEQARLQQEREKAAKLQQEKAERERAQTERAAAAERARLEEERRATQVAEEKRQREQAEREAQKTPASELITKSDLETIMGFTFQEPGQTFREDPAAPRASSAWPKMR